MPAFTDHDNIDILGGREMAETNETVQVGGQVELYVRLMVNVENGQIVNVFLDAEEWNRKDFAVIEIDEVPDGATFETAGGAMIAAVKEQLAEASFEITDRMIKDEA